MSKFVKSRLKDIVYVAKFGEPTGNGTWKDVVDFLGHQAQLALDRMEADRPKSLMERNIRIRQEGT